MIKHLLSIIIFLPIAGAVMLFFLPRKWDRMQRSLAFVFTLFTFIAACIVMIFFRDSSGFQFIENFHWFTFGHFQITYFLGVDGVSLFLVLLTAFLTPLAILASRSINLQVREFFIFLLVLESGILGVFLALDLVLFYLFWEVMLIPMYFLIGIWGSQNRIYAAFKFVLFTLVGSLLMLAAIIALYYLHGNATGDYTFSYCRILESLELGHFTIPVQPQMLLFLAFGLAFAIKIPLFPLHTWLPDAHVEAPTAGSVILAGVLLKMGTYGLLRFCLPLFPNSAITAAPYISIIALIGIIYGALVAMVQPDLKKLVAYSSVSHMGYIVLGIFSFNVHGAHGATLQMLNHGLSTGALFLLVGMIYDRRHTRQISDFGGLAHQTPVYATFFMIIALSSIGLPGLNGFVGEILILQGAFLANRTFAIIAASGMILAAVYMLWMYQRVFFGVITKEENRLINDLNWREKLILTPIVIVIIWIGVYSSTFLRPMDESLQKILSRVHHSEDVSKFEIQEALRIPNLSK